MPAHPVHIVVAARGLKRLGLSHKVVGELLEVPFETVKNWSRSSRPKSSRPHISETIFRDKLRDFLCEGDWLYEDMK